MMKEPPSNTFHVLEWCPRRGTMRRRGTKIHRSLYELHILGVGVTQCRYLDDSDAMVRDYIALEYGLTKEQVAEPKIVYHSAELIRSPDSNGYRGRIVYHEEETRVHGLTKGDVLTQLLHELALLVERTPE